MLFLLFILFALVSGCSSDSECGSSDYTQPGRCVAGICQCGVGYSGNRPIDPITCSLTCSPQAVPDAITFLNEPNVTVTASGGNLVLDVGLAPFLKQTPSSMAFLNPSNGSACSLMPEKLGLGAWAQTVQGDVCHMRNLYEAPFAATVGQACWLSLPDSTVTGADLSVTFKSYQTQVEVIQQGAAPFGQIATKRRLEANETMITRAFRRDYTVTVATRFTAQSVPFSVYAANVTEPTAPTAVDDAVSTDQTVAVTVSVLSNDVAGTNDLLASTLRVSVAATHGVASVVAGGQIRYTPTGLYHGSDSFEYEICDNTTLLCDLATVSVTVLPDGPTALDDGARVSNGGSVEVNVLANDVSRVGGLVTLTIVSGPANGTASVTAGNRVLYTAVPGFFGIVSVEYRICDASIPTALCDEATLLIDVGGVGPIAVGDAASVNQSASGPVQIAVLSNDVQGSLPLNLSSVRIVSNPEHGTASMGAGGVVSYVPNAGYHGSDVLEYEVCDTSVPEALCSRANVSIVVVARGPTAVDDSAQTAYLTAVTVAVLSNDLAGAQPLQASSVSILQQASNGVAVVEADGRIRYTPASGFTGSDTIRYEVCDNSTPTALCSSALLTVVVQGIPAEVIVLRYRLVTIDYDVLGQVMRATVQTQTPVTAKVANIQLWSGANPSTGLASVIGQPTTGAACAPDSPAGLCNQFHVVTFAGNPCAISAGQLVLSADFQCASGGAPASCGYINARSSYRLGNLVISYDACPRVVVYGIDTAASKLHLHTDVARATVVADPQQQGATLYGRCAIAPSAGASFQTVTLVALKAFRQAAGGAVDLGNQLAATQRLQMLSPLTQTSAASGVWDFDLLLEEAFFSVTEVYYLEATIDLTFANTGALTTKRLTLPMMMLGGGGGAQKKSLLRAKQQQHMELMLVSRDGGSSDAGSAQTGVLSEKFQLRSAASAGGATTAAVSSASSGGSTAMIAGIAAGVAVAALAGVAIIAAVLIRRRRNKSDTSDTPLTVVGSSNDLDL